MKKPMCCKGCVRKIVLLLKLRISFLCALCENGRKCLPMCVIQMMRFLVWIYDLEKPSYRLSTMHAGVCAIPIWCFDCSESQQPLRPFAPPPRPPALPREPPAAPLAARYLPSPVHIRRALDVVEVQNQSSQGGAEPAQPQQDHHRHPSIAPLPPPNRAAPNPRESKTETLQGRLEVLFLKEKQIFVSLRCVNSNEQVPSETIYTRCGPSSLSTPLLHFLPPYPTQASTNPFKSV